MDDSQDIEPEDVGTLDATVRSAEDTPPKTPLSAEELLDVERARAKGLEDALGAMIANRDAWVERAEKAERAIREAFLAIQK